MSKDNGKRIIINLSDDDYDDINNIDLTSSSSEDDYELTDDDDDFHSSDDDESDDDDNDDDESDDDDNDDKKGGGDEVTLVNQVLHFLKEKRDLQELSVKACKSYLRKHGLRVSGNKDECVQRVLEHWRIKDGKAEVLYPRSSFNVNCKGDVCRGDIVLFTQKVYGSFDKVTRNGKLAGKRTVAGRVVKESYGEAKQQHTFTVEVLWTKGLKKLSPLFPLLVKGRNLYRLNTYRQPWTNEGERRTVLDEKHRRGTAARLVREKRKKSWSSGKGLKSQKVGHGPRSSKMNCSKGGKNFGRDQGVSTSNSYTTSNSSQNKMLKQPATKHTAKTKVSKPCKRQQNTTLQRHHTASSKHPNPPRTHYGSVPSMSATTNFQHNFLYDTPILRPAVHYVSPPAEYSGFYHNLRYVHPPRLAHENNLQYHPTENASGRPQYGLLRCSILGCIGPGSDRCVIAACWRCCRREGMRCNVHR